LNHDNAPAGGDAIWKVVGDDTWTLKFPARPDSGPYSMQIPYIVKTGQPKQIAKADFTVP
jgi:hypothetical protein